MEEPRTERDDQQEEHADPRVQRPRNGRVQPGLTRGAHKGENGADDIELRRLTRGPYGAHFADGRVEENVEPAADAVLGGIFPCLSSVAMLKIVRWFPVVEGLIAVLDGCVGGSETVRDEEDVKRYGQWDVEGGRSSSVGVSDWLTRSGIGAPASCARGSLPFRRKIIFRRGRHCRKR